jgi:parvulin-like peptidyl-prolyl isomerase
MSKVKKLPPLTLIEAALRAIPVRDKYEELLFQGLQALSLQEAEQYENFVSVEMNYFLRENWDHYPAPHQVLIALFNQDGVAPRDRIEIRVPILAAIIPFFDDAAWARFDKMILAELASKSSQAVADAESAKKYEGT